MGQVFCTCIWPFRPSCAAGVGAAKMESTMAAKPAVVIALNLRNSRNFVIVELPPASIPETGDKKYTSPIDFFARITPRHEPHGATGHKHTTRGLERRRCRSAP